MLVYANNLCFHGPDAEEAIFKAVGAWTKEQLGYGLHPTQHREDGEHKGKRGDSSTWLRIMVTDEEEPRMYSWVLKVSDNAVKGRQWITELGLKVHDDELFFSCVLSTDEYSTMVVDPVMPSRPRVIQYVVDNIQRAKYAYFQGTVPGSIVQNIGENIDTYRGLLSVIEDKQRNYPILIVSPDREGNYLLNTDHLQQIVVGLAQVVRVSSDFDSYDMEEILGRKWSAWDGAVNMIHTAAPNGFVRGRFFLSEEIHSWGKTQHDRISQILAWVTNNTNIPRMRKRIRSEGVVQLALRRRLQISRAKTSEMDDSQLRQELESVWQLADEQSLRIDESETEISRLENELELKDSELLNLHDAIRRKDFDIESLKENLAQSGAGKAVDNRCAGMMLELLMTPDQPTPLECLNIIEEIHGDKCVILESAKNSAQDMINFNHGRRLLRNLNLLATEYREKLMQGGDSLAKNVFGRNEYAATESETVMSNSAMRKFRIFEYKGKPVEMFRHLKIGVEDDASKTIRVHFYWDSKNRKIVIGYCGKHLPVSSH